MKKNYNILTENELLSEGESRFGLMIEKDAGFTGEMKVEKLNESTDSNKGITRILIDCILQKANVQNRNGRIYPKPVLEREVKKYMKLIEASNSFGENSHPETPTISLKRTDLSHLVRKVWWDGDTLYGTIELITSDGYFDHGGLYCEGDNIANLLKRGYKIGISSRGLGSLKNVRGQNLVQDDFELLGWDIVGSPSTPDAYLFQETKTINENTLLRNNNKNNEKLLKFLGK